MMLEDTQLIQLTSSITLFDENFGKFHQWVKIDVRNWFY